MRVLAMLVFVACILCISTSTRAQENWQVRCDDAQAQQNVAPDGRDPSSGMSYSQLASVACSFANEVDWVKRCQSGLDDVSRSVLCAPFSPGDDEFAQGWRAAVAECVLSGDFTLGRTDVPFFRDLDDHAKGAGQRFREMRCANVFRIARAYDVVTPDQVNAGWQSRCEAAQQQWELELNGRDDAGMANSIASLIACNLAYASDWSMRCKAAADDLSMSVLCTPLVPEDSEFVDGWSTLVGQCASGAARVSVGGNGFLTSISEYSDSVGEYYPDSLWCKDVLLVAQAYDVIASQEVAEIQTAVESEKREREAAARKARLEKGAADYPETYMKLSVSGRFEDVARGIEIRDPEPLRQTYGYIFAGGVVDALLLCPTGIGPVERTQLLGFAANALLKARSQGSGDSDQIFLAVREARGFFDEGLVAGNSLDCAEPATTKLLENVVSMLR